MAGMIVLPVGVGATVTATGSFSGCAVALNALMLGLLARSAAARLPNDQHQLRLCAQPLMLLLDSKA
jgi:hypothetical protein